jgi:hypothetical protein
MDKCKPTIPQTIGTLFLRAHTESTGIVARCGSCGDVGWSAAVDLADAVLRVGNKVYTNHGGSVVAIDPGAIGTLGSPGSGLFGKVPLVVPDATMWVGDRTARMWPGRCGARVDAHGMHIRQFRVSLRGRRTNFSVSTPRSHWIGRRASSGRLRPVREIHKNVHSKFRRRHTHATAPLVRFETLCTYSFDNLGLSTHLSL